MFVRRGGVGDAERVAVLRDVGIHPRERHAPVACELVAGVVEGLTALLTALGTSVDAYDDALHESEADHTYDTSKVEAFFLPAGMAVEVYATTLHYAPCHANEDGFRVAIVLPRGTNYPLKAAHAKVADVSNGAGVTNEDAMITAVNKWLIGHAEGGLDEGSFLGLKGKNLCLTEDFE